MKSYRKELRFHLPTRRGIVNITPQVEEALKESGIREGLVLVTREGAHYSTDSRYIEAARQEVQGAQVELVTRERGHLALAAGYLQEHGLKRVGFESGAVSVDALARYETGIDIEYD